MLATRTTRQGLGALSALMSRLYILPVGSECPAISFLPHHPPTTLTHTLSRRVLSRTIQRQRTTRRCEVRRECRPSHHCRPARRSRFGIHQVDKISFAVARSETGAKSPKEVLRRCSFMANVHRAKVPMSPKSTARRKLKTGCHGNSMSFRTGRRPRRETKDSSEAA